jgi:hypothetical protein
MGVRGDIAFELGEVAELVVDGASTAGGAPPNNGPVSE